MSNPFDVWSWVPQPYPAAILLALLVGLIWLSVVAPGWWRTAAVLPVALVGIVLFAPAIAWLQVPLQAATGSLLVSTFGAQAVGHNLLLAAIPSTLESGIVQEAVKLLPVLLYVVLVGPRGEKGPLRVGAAAGAAFGAMEAAWALGLVFAAGFSLDTLQLSGWQGVLPFWERFFVVGFHTASGLILGYGLVFGLAPLMYVVAVLMHSLLNYPIVLVQANLLDPIALEGIIAVWALLCVALAIVLRRHAGR